ncbi:ABC transporter ATP-binding protein [Actinoallomurus rhizosphaericola]|uniref:ABC transporter ATP-binding protein n=1 Tax=Actinoallomurus rhizosphaericola TaxID=2952536 RepID=UPI002092592C|nr:ABC transporter ATP-binding protein [Actinoallomurus rhizosphaericola]MCO5996364.1 ABC transporter ATP-binding protein [Actinoallomurus rhizosphaericola]
MTEVVLDAVNKVYPDGFHAVRNMSLRVADGELFVLLGPSGCGKSTLLRMVAGLEDITSGELWLGGKYANDLPPRDRDLAMVFQNGALYPHRDVRGNISFPLEISGDDSPASHERIVELSRALGIEETLHRLPSTLSGGQRQRVAMGRALIREPGIFLMDEPLSNLDAGLRTELRMEISALVRTLGVTTLYVTHDQTEALTLADRLAIMRQGVLQDVGTPQQVYDDPATMFVAAFLSAPPINLIKTGVWADQQEGIILGLGNQRLVLPWTDPRSPSLVAHHGRYITVGVRADALRPAPDGLITGRVRALEFHGSEWLAYAEAGLPHVDAEAPYGNDPAWIGPEQEHGAGRGLLRRLLRTAGLFAEEPTPQPVQHDGHHRRSDVVFRLESRSGVSAGDVVRLAVDTDRMLLFGEDGRRVDPVRR